MYGVDEAGGVWEGWGLMRCEGWEVLWCFEGSM